TKTILYIHTDYNRNSTTAAAPGPAHAAARGAGRPPAMSILTGTASWTDPTLLACGRFYPPHVRTPEARLRHYAGQFGMAEVDATYYGLPSGHMAHAWATRTPARFVFNVKAFRLFTGH